MVCKSMSKFVLMIKVNIGMVLPVLLYFSEPWSIGATEQGRLIYLSTGALHRIMGYRMDNFISNERLLHA